MTREQRLEALRDEIRRHHGCGFEPCETSTHAVPGEGTARARVMFVGEAPGAQEDRTGRPFVGAAGKLLDELLESVGMTRDDVYITNVLKARPPGNRDPRAAEVAHSWPWLEQELAIVEPDVIVPLGRHALARFAPGLKVTEAKGKLVHDEAGRALFPLLHPAVALRARDRRQELFDDIAGLPAALESGPGVRVAREEAEPESVQRQP
ncbi:MAG: uracil-DNA glycosylase [Solirubrobacterales bacterium]|nr:uracil-DNA glycosylase [Solirubrobacterales bacterium]